MKNAKKFKFLFHIRMSLMCIIFSCINTLLDTNYYSQLAGFIL